LNRVKLDNDFSFERRSSDALGSLERSLIERALHGDISVVYECDIPSFAMTRADAIGTPLLHALASKGAATVDLLRVMTLEELMRQGEVRMKMTMVARPYMQWLKAYIFPRLRFFFAPLQSL
jgi:hypothetical protein